MARAWQALRPLLELRVLIAVFVLGALAWGFIELAEEVVEGDTRAFDQTLLMALRVPGDPALPIGPAWLPGAVRDLTALGSYTVLSLVTVATAIGLGLARRPGAATLVLVAAIGAVLWITLFKLGFARPRPELVPHGMRATSWSFPSGHSTGAAAIYLTLGAILASFQERRRIKLFVLGVAVVVTVLVGLSRVYLGVHWPSDVVGGWALGAGWAVFCWLVALWLRRHRLLRGPLHVSDEPPG